MKRSALNCGFRFGWVVLALLALPCFSLPRFSLLKGVVAQEIPIAAERFVVPAHTPSAPFSPSLEATDSYDTLVVAAPQLLPSLGRWVKYRTAQGHRLLVVNSQAFSSGNQFLIKRIVGRYPTIKNLVLVGDAGDWTQPPTALVPTDHVLAEVNVMFGSEPEIATDNTYADINGDAVPELTVGRIAAVNGKELDQYIDRVIAYEAQDADPSWRRRINLVAGLGGFGAVTDGLIESTAKQIITEKIPASYETSVTYASWQSPYCPDPRQFSETIVERFNEGCLFWIYVGHGDRQRLDQVRVPNRQFDILDAESATSMACRSGSPIAIFLACYTGAMDASRDCLAEQMIKQPGGPIAVICGSRVTMPYAMSLLSIEMADEFFKGDCQSIGQLLRIAKRGMVDPSPPRSDDDYRQLIESMGQALSPLPDQLVAEKREHLHLVNLLGDPLLRLQRPGKVELQCSGDAVAGELLEIQGQSNIGGELTIELVYRRDRFRSRIKRRRKFEADDENLAQYQNTYAQAHDQVCVTQHRTVSPGTFVASIKIPDDVKGECEIRAMIVGADGQAGQRQMALGSRPVKVSALPKATDSSAASARRSASEMKTPGNVLRTR